MVTGPNTRQNVMGYLEEALGECIARGCYRLPVEERLEGPRLRTVEVFEIVSRGMPIAVFGSVTKAGAWIVKIKPSPAGAGT